MPRCFTKEINALQGVLDAKLVQYEARKTENHSLQQHEKALLQRIQSARGGVEALQALPQQDNYPGAQGSRSLQETLAQQEYAIQALLQMLGVEDEYEQLYTSKLLRQLAADPIKQQVLTARTTTEALQRLAAASKMLSILLVRYDTDGPTPQGWNAKQQLDDLIDRAIEGTLFRGLMEFPRRNTSWLSINMEIMQPEPYPEGWFKHVAQGMGLSSEQKAKLRFSWEKGAADKAKLLARYEQLAAQLELLQQQQLQKCEAFCRQASRVEDECKRSAALLKLRRSSRSPAGSADSQGQQAGAAPKSSTASGASGGASDMLPAVHEQLGAGEEMLYASGVEQQQLEAELADVVSKLTLLYLVQGMQIYNVATRKQLAAGVVYAYPFAPDPIQTCEAFAELGW